MRDPLSNVPPEERERVTKPIAALEEAFRPVADSLTYADEPAVLFDAAEDGE